MSDQIFSVPSTDGGIINFTVSSIEAEPAAEAFADNLSGLKASGKLFVDKITSPGQQILPVPAGMVGVLIIDERAAAGTDKIRLPPHYDFVLNLSTTNLSLDETTTPDKVAVFSAGNGSTTVFGGTGGGSFVADGSNNYFQALNSGGGDYLINFGTGYDTVWASSGNNVIDAGAGRNLVGLGSGTNTVLSEGPDTILASTGLGHVFAGPGAQDLIFGSTGTLEFVGGSEGTASTIIGGSGNEALLGGQGSGLFFFGSGHFTLDAQSANDTVVGAAGSPRVDLRAEGGGAITLFSSTAGNTLSAGSGNETLNAAGASGGNVLTAGNGNDLLVGGSGPDSFTFVFGRAGGSDLVRNWASNDTLALRGYAAHGGYSETTVNGNATIGLHDGTKITFANVPNIPLDHIVLT